MPGTSAIQDNCKLPIEWSHNDVFWGGGSRPAGILRDLLEEHIEMVPNGGSIYWATYYFRDRRLAKALINARRRGVNVKVALDGRPRTRWANREIISMFEGSEGINGGLRIVMPIGRLFRLHTKLYYFSHPYPHAFIGSFNPSGDDPEEHPEILQEIGDQYRGFNFLVNIRVPELVKKLAEHADQIHKTGTRLWLPLTMHQNMTILCHDTKLFFLPRIMPLPVRSLLKRLASDSECLIAASHIKGSYAVNMLLGLARKGCNVKVLSETTTRRVPSDVENRFKQAGIQLLRIGLKREMPMHDKFMLIRQGSRKWVIFGSFNWTSKSLLRNQEIGVISSSHKLYAIFKQRWEELKHWSKTDLKN